LDPNKRFEPDEQPLAIRLSDTFRSSSAAWLLAAQPSRQLVERRFSMNMVHPEILATCARADVVLWNAFARSQRRDVDNFSDGKIVFPDVCCGKSSLFSGSSSWQAAVLSQARSLLIIGF
jgi:hypothetical protein